MCFIEQMKCKVGIKMIIAHRDSDTGQTQLLMDHLFNVAELSITEAEEVEQSQTAYLLGLLHDLGKADRNFQKKLKGKPNMKVNHSSAGGKYFFELLLQNRNLIRTIPEESQWLFLEFIEVIIYIITAHHGLYDIWSLHTDMNHMQHRLQYIEDEKYFYEEDVLHFAKDLEIELQKRKKVDFKQLILHSFSEFVNLDKKLSPKDEDERAFYTSMKIRLLLSILKNADIEDTINAYDKVIKPFNMKELQNKKQNYLKEIEQVYEKFSEPTNKINFIRTRLGDEGLQRGKTDGPGIYQLNLPTGAGKTLISLRYGMHQLNEQSKARFIYITPFLSVLEQNADEIKKILKDEDIVEHHSNVIKDTYVRDESIEEVDSKKESFNQYLIDTWSSPVVLSTMVQFFQTLFKGKASNIRRFSSLINSVIVLDEVQSLPITATHIFNLTMNFVSQVMNSTIIMCTATQPTYDSKYIKYKLNYGGKEGEISNIVRLTEEERVIFNRNEVYLLNDNQISNAKEICDEVLSHPEDSMLVILNTKKAVKQVYDELSGRTNRQLYYLTTNLCPKHRQDIVKEMKNKLVIDEPIICVSTQLIEAGVDIDFKRLIRSYAGIDSIIQAMGRCNRHGKHSKKGIVKLVKVNKDFENIERIEEIKEKVKATSYILKDVQSPIDIVALNDNFYEYYFANNQLKMDFPLSPRDSPSGFDYLSQNKSLYDRTMKENSVFQILNQSFQTASKNIDLINNETTGVIVYYKESEEMVDQLIERINQFERTFEGKILAEIKNDTQKLQPYTVNMYLTFESRQHVTSYLDDSIHILIQDSYNEKTGVMEELDALLSF